jgi:hypothetical protein
VRDREESVPAKPKTSAAGKPIIKVEDVIRRHLQYSEVYLTMNKGRW